MSQQPLELILARQFADSLTMAVFLVDPEGNLLFYNEAAEDILGIRFSITSISAKISSIIIVSISLKGFTDPST